MWEVERVVRFERLAVRLASLRGVEDGDVEAIGDYIFRKHVMYNGSFLRRVISFFVRQPYNEG